MKGALMNKHLPILVRDNDIRAQAAGYAARRREGRSP
jgi:hypothetical protein